MVWVVVWMARISISGTTLCGPGHRRAMSKSEISIIFDDTFSEAFSAVVSDAVERSTAPRHLVFSSTRLLHLTSLG